MKIWAEGGLNPVEERHMNGTQSGNKVNSKFFLVEPLN